MPALSPLAASNANHAFAARLLRDLADGGVTHCCICAGSRSAPLAAVAATTPGLAWSTHVDERSAGFFALGLARGSRRPVALICTSGTAAANFLPAVAEGGRARVPLVVLTADRPPERRDRGAPQTIDQLRLYGTHVRWFVDAPVPADASRPERLARALAVRALREAWGGSPGPVHLNLPFREPLAPTGARASAPVRPRLTPRPAAATEDAAWRPVAAAVAAADRPVFVAGPWDPPGAQGRVVLDWARRVGAPVLAEPLSGLPAEPSDAQWVRGVDALLRCDAFAHSVGPDVIVRFGSSPTSKALNRWIAGQSEARVFAVDPEGAREDPDLCVDEWVDAGVPASAEALAPGNADPQWRARWEDAAKRARDAIAALVAGRSAPTPGRWLRLVAQALPEPCNVVLANSLAVRDAECFLPPTPPGVRFFGNRGANGIDGLLSTALGVAAGTGQPTFLLTGDLALLHDAGAWWTARRMDLPVTVVAFNDGGGGIFDHLQVADAGARVAFEQVFRMSHTQALAPIAAAYGCASVEVRDEASFARALRTPGPALVEVRIDPSRNLHEHRAVWAAVDAALSAGGAR